MEPTYSYHRDRGDHWGFSSRDENVVCRILPLSQLRAKQLLQVRLFESGRQLFNFSNDPSAILLTFFGENFLARQSELI